MNIRRLKVVAECGMLLATALALTNFRIFQMPNGGSVSLGALPLFIIAARHGMLTGMFAGILMGLLMLAFRPFIVHPLQFVLDYPLAFAAAGLAGWSEWKTGLKAATATTVANIFRLHFHVVAGAVFFVAGKENLLQVIMASYAYNLTHIIPETILCSVIAFYIARNNPALCARQISRAS